MPYSPRNKKLLVSFTREGGEILLPDTASVKAGDNYEIKVLAVAPDCDRDADGHSLYNPGDVLLLNPETRHIYPVTDNPKTAIINQDVVMAVITKEDK